MHLDRRALLASVLALAACSSPPAALAGPDRFAASPWRKLTPEQWKARLPGPSFDVLREEGTELAFSSPLNNEHRHGIFACLGCGLPLFKSEWKFDSGTGWPSFYTEIGGALGKKVDNQIVEQRTEYHCAQCLGHQGHVFNDGPQPTGLRYCNNGVALKFVAA